MARGSVACWRYCCAGLNERAPKIEPREPECFRTLGLATSLRHRRRRRDAGSETRERFVTTNDATFARITEYAAHPQACVVEQRVYARQREQRHDCREREPAGDRT